MMRFPGRRRSSRPKNIWVFFFSSFRERASRDGRATSGSRATTAHDDQKIISY